MLREQHDSISYWAGDLHRLAKNLEKEAATWSSTDSPQDSSSTADASKKWVNILWINAVEAGVVIFELCGLGAFDTQPRIKNVICQIRGELNDQLQKFKVPFDHLVLNIPYGLRTGRSYDVYFVKIFEGVCKVWPKSHDDSRVLDIYYGSLTEKAKIHAKIMCEVGDFLKDCSANKKT